MLQCICAFISFSALRAAVLRKFVQTETSTSRRKSKLIPLCETRWIERHDSVTTFAKLMPWIYRTLHEFSD